MNGLSALMFENVTFAAFRITQNFSGDLINSLLNLFHWGEAHRDNFVYTVTSSELEIFRYDSHFIRETSNHGKKNTGKLTYSNKQFTKNRAFPRNIRNAHKKNIPTLIQAYI